ncbi:MAG: hypothetical protein AVDCRST_MAG07-2307, partial [uncultured Frankineae bacterium]
DPAHAPGPARRHRPRGEPGGRGGGARPDVVRRTGRAEQRDPRHRSRTGRRAAVAGGGRRHLRRRPAGRGQREPPGRGGRRVRRHRARAPGPPGL